MGAADGRLSSVAPTASARQLRAALQKADGTFDPAVRLRELVAQGLDALPLPGAGQTLERWRALAAVAGHDLSLAKLYEGHTDALAILAELEGTESKREFTGTDGIWGVWASEGPDGRLGIEPDPAGEPGAVLLRGVKHWCSGAQTGTHALVTAWHPDESCSQLVRVNLAQPGVEVRSDRWKAVGMAGSASLQVRFHAARAYRVGGAGAYVSRPGFWHGGAGIAACWYGGAVALAEAFRQSILQGSAALRSPFRLAAAGRVDVLLQGVSLMLQHAASWIDQHPREDASLVALRVRLAAARCATQVLDEVGSAWGPTPYCTDAAFARMAADLPVFVRQSHADRDYAALAEKLPFRENDLWAL
ncbi:MAG: hypothetical protein B7X59_03590 [Polaromonas sp. 39-63-203]|jgi:hypothetical protein|uniref:acyl-CoA dehydrogenase family protein n=1 Tax=Polaromonas sp. TaxID=1869339 RepID=UPI000BCED972|nr:acyl-CoA dehydrogenase family protein [Polaromonas sp.]OYZ03456.1 MAG: hypothetical protein B7Y42_00315 [Polaromonas sp. 28-63-22]OYZ84361.1 MAG: hypothetical protein B7Y03_04260 [Polaromonas sp. 24-62-144]OZA99754.1 MAG: hypothetical protein B7X59_03590 [Polaromonas sp. 39-63-203]HQS32190.1 acyl-CoA dehydrogenase family protein [Polaromonas sp.]HQS92488.1 acyl-CoA dehydrogenase family protein [Polaromonas sp.]